MSGSTRTVQDRDVPALAVLLGDEHRHVLQAAIAPTGGSVRRTRLRQIRYVPEVSVTAQYDVQIATGAAIETATLVVASGVSVPDSAIRLQAADVELAVWAYPNDPFLPGLRSAADPVRAAEVLGDLGVRADGVELRRRAYRPGRRAVIEVEGGSASLYMKVVRPHRTSMLHEIHEAMGADMPVPRSLGWSRRLGIVALQGMPGRPLRQQVQSGSTELPPPGALLELLDQLPALDRDAAAGPVSRLPSYAGLIGAIVPELRGRVAAMADALGSTPVETPVTAHGDFHAGQVLVAGGRITGLVDVDTAGIGERSNDLAGLLAQLSTLALTSAERGALDRYGAELIAEFDRSVDPVGLRLRVAAAVLGFATGPFRVQMKNWPDATTDRVALAERWMASAQLIAGGL